jgi:hypothetical protein
VPATLTSETPTVFEAVTLRCIDDFDHNEYEVFDSCVIPYYIFDEIPTSR